MFETERLLIRRFKIEDTNACFESWATDIKLGRYIITYPMQNVSQMEIFVRRWLITKMQKSPIFASGIVDGYFDHNVPEEFWRLFALYISNNILSSLPWAIRFGQEEIDVMIKQEKDILEWYDHMRTPIPKWYRNNKK